MHELLSDASRWTKGASAKDAYGVMVDANDSTAIRWCLRGAAIKCYKADFTRIWEVIKDEISQRSPMAWNDRSSRTFPEVRALLLKLDI